MKSKELSNDIVKLKPNKYQEKIYDFVKNGSGNAIVEAVAGSGKTTTLLECIKLIPNYKSSIFVAFNKTISEELNKKLKGRKTNAKTLHALGLGIIFKNRVRKPEVDNDKIDKIVEKRFKHGDVEFKFFLKKIIPMIKATLCEVNIQSVSDLMLDCNIQGFLDKSVIKVIGEILKESEEMNAIDYGDMIWIPVVQDMIGPEYDWVFVDETQDLNKAQFELVKKICNGHTRIIAVGDSRQSIYLFRGADIDSMKNFKEYFNAKELPLSISYRCPKNVVRLANEIVPEMEYADDAIDGIVDDMALDDALKSMKEGDLVLCRTNAPLVSVAYSLIRMDKKAIILGRDIGKNLVSIIDRYKTHSLTELVNKVKNSISLQNQKIESGQYEKQRMKLMSVIDSHETILAISENVGDINELKHKIKTLFSNKKKGIICSSVHKAKGLESDVVYIHNYNTLMPHPMAVTEKERHQEENIRYVAITRAKKELHLIIGKSQDRWS